MTDLRQRNWTVEYCPDCDRGSELLWTSEHHHELREIPVVPADDDAVERMAQCLYETDDERVRVDGVEWENEPDGYRWLYRNRVRELLEAARRL